MDHDVIGPAVRKGLEQGRLEGRREGELAILRCLISKRFGPLPSWVDDRLSNLPLAALQDLSLKILDANNLDELF